MKYRGQRGRSQGTIDLFRTCTEIIRPVQPITVRGVCYRLFVAGKIDSMERKNTKKISEILTLAREDGVIPWEWIVDESREMERSRAWKDLTSYAKVIEQAYRRDFWAHQKNHVIVISEKATVSGILRPVLQEYGVPFFASHGFNSTTKMHDFAEEIAFDKRRTVILYCGDYDPSGMYMSSVDLPNRLAKYGASSMGDFSGGDLNGDYVLKRIALTHMDVLTGNLPPFKAETKKADSRYKWFVGIFGEQCWELDAMNPNDLRDRVEKEILEYVNPDDWQKHQQIEEAQRQTTKQIAESMRAATA
jgi:hypothetical protein